PPRRNLYSFPTRRSSDLVVELVRKQAWHEAVDTLYDEDIVSVEARTMDGSSPETRGIKGVREKVDWWLENMQVHSFKADGPFVEIGRHTSELQSLAYLVC